VLQAFARLSAVYGGTYMLNKPDVQVAYDNGVAFGVTAEGETAKAKLVVGDPSYFPGKVRKTSRVRWSLNALNVAGHI
jgi:Rab GDP dissociation inhibitor